MLRIKKRFILAGGLWIPGTLIVIPILTGLWLFAADGPGGLPAPPNPGPGFAVSVGPEQYGTRERPLKNGDIYHFIDGGGTVYLRHGFVAVSHAVFADGDNNEVTVDIFDMGSGRNAERAYADEAICPSGYERISIGVEAKAYHFEPDYFISFIKGKYLVYCHVGNDALSPLLSIYAKTLFQEVL